METISPYIENEIKQDTILRIILQRHGPKLSATGEKNETAEYFIPAVQNEFHNMNLDGQGLVHISNSPIKRAEQTADIDLSMLNQTDHRVKNDLIPRDELATPYQSPEEIGQDKYSHDYLILVNIQQAIEPEIKSQVDQLNFDNQEQKEAEIRNRIDMEILKILFDKTQAEKMGLLVPYEEMADNMAKRYNGYLNHLDLLESQKESGKQPDDEPYTQIDISHSFPIMSFLKKYLIFDDNTPADSLDGEVFLEKTGGVIKESSFLTMDFVKTERGCEINIESSPAQNTQFKGKINLRSNNE